MLLDQCKYARATFRLFTFLSTNQKVKNRVKGRSRWVNPSMCYECPNCPHSFSLYTLCRVIQSWWVFILVTVKSSLLISLFIIFCCAALLFFPAEDNDEMTDASQIAKETTLSDWMARLGWDKVTNEYVLETIIELIASVPQHNSEVLIHPQRLENLVARAQRYSVRRCKLPSPAWFSTIRALWHYE